MCCQAIAAKKASARHRNGTVGRKYQMKVWLRSPERMSHGTYVAAAAARITGSGRASRQLERHHVKSRPMSATIPGHHTTGLPSAKISRYEPPASLNQ